MPPNRVETTYFVGVWHGIVSDHAIALLPPNVPLATVEQIWLELREGMGLAALVDGLSEAFGTGLRALPEFAIASTLDTPGSLNVAVRGPIEARVAVADSAPLVVTGASVITWSERMLSGVTAVELVAPDAVTQDLRPIRDGVVPAGRISMTIETTNPGQPRARHAGTTLISESSSVAGDLISDSRNLSDGELVSEPAGAAKIASRTEPEVRIPAAQPTLDSVPEAPPVAKWVSAPSISKAAPSMAADPNPNSMIIDAPDVAAESSDVRADADSDPVAGSAGQSMLSETMLASSVEAAARRPDSDSKADPHDTVSDQGLILPPTSGEQSGGNLQTGESGAGSVDGDHDNLTLGAEQIRELQAAGLQRAPGPSRDGRAPVQLVVPGAVNVILDRAAIIGRRPRLTRVAGGHVPQLVTVPSPGGGVSGNHIELRIEGVSVLAVDLDSTNGTRLLRLGRQPVRLPPGEETLLVPGDQLDLGEGILLSFEGLL